MSSADVADDSRRLVADVASELEERLALETGGNAAVECKCEAVGVDSENRYLECTYEVREGSGNGGAGGGRNNVTEKNKINNAMPPPVAVELLRKQQQQNKKQQGVVAVKVP